MTTWLRVTEIARRTNLSRRYWQRRFGRGDVPGVRQIDFGRRRLFLVDRRAFETWWAQRLLAIPTSPSGRAHEIKATTDVPDENAPGAIATAAPHLVAENTSVHSQHAQRTPRRRSLTLQRDPRQQTFAFDDTSIETGSDGRPKCDEP
jgi:hypothetical protein